jgi:hypothetical protein
MVNISGWEKYFLLLCVDVCSAISFVTTNEHREISFVTINGHREIGFVTTNEQGD